MIFLHFVPASGWIRFVLYMIPYLLIGYDIFQRKNFQKTEGQVVTVGWQGDLQTENQEEYIMVSYMADGVSYVEKQQILSRIFYREGQKVTVYYDKKDPHRTWNRLRLPFMLALLVLCLSCGIMAFRKERQM